MNYKFKMLICALFTVAALTLALTAIADDGEVVNVLNTSSVSTAGDGGFILKEYNGYIGIYFSDSGKIPMTVTDIEVKNLRNTDRDMIRAGLHVKTEREVMELLEDLGS